MKLGWPIAIGVGVGMLLLSGSAKGEPVAKLPQLPEGVSVEDVPTGHGDRRSEQELIWSLGRKVEAMGILPGFAEYLLSTAYVESQFNPEAGSDAVDNAARGWFGMRPESAFNWKNGLTHLQDQPNLLKDPRWAVAAAADYAKRMFPYLAPGQEMDFMALRRGWSWASKVSDRTSSWAQQKEGKYEDALTKVGLPTDLVHKRIPLGDYPGINAILEELDAPQA